MTDQLRLRRPLKRLVAATVCGAAALGMIAACSDPAPSSPPSVVASTSLSTTDTGAVRRDIPYAGDASPEHRLDLYLPAAEGPTSRGSGPSTTAYPLVLYIHGGAWTAGDKSVMSGSSDGIGALRDTLVSHGYAVASMNYRLVPAAVFPAQIHDVKAAVRFLRAQGPALGVDPRRIGVVGDSAGGHLAELLALTPGVPALEGSIGTPPSPGVDSTVRAAVSYYGISDLGALGEDRRRHGCGAGVDGPTSMEGALLGGIDPTAAGNAPRVREASPMSYAGRARTPLLLFHGTRDCLVPPEQSRDLHDALTAAGSTSELTEIDADHADPEFFTAPALQRQLVAFLDRYLAEPAGQTSIPTAEAS